MKIGLNVLERSTLLGILPKEGNIITLRLIRELTGKVGLSAQDFVTFDIKTEHDKKDPEKTWTTWNERGSAPTEIEFAAAEIEQIKKALTELNTNQKLKMDQMSVYDKFMIATDPVKEV